MVSLEYGILYTSNSIVCKWSMFIYNCYVSSFLYIQINNIRFDVLHEYTINWAYIYTKHTDKRNILWFFKYKLKVLYPQTNTNSTICKIIGCKIQLIPFSS